MITVVYKYLNICHHYLGYPFEISISLTLNLTHFHDIFTLIEHTPNLIYLNTQSELSNAIWGENPWELNSDIKLDGCYLKFKPECIIGYLAFF
jgi:hypothetical protein